MGALRRPFVVFGLAAAAAAAVLLVILQVLSPSSPASAQDDEPVIAAHRGGAALYPENTMTGFEAVARDHPDMALEMDVQPLADGTLVVFHDDLVDKVAADGQTGPVADMTAKEWRKLRLKNPAGGEPAPAAFLADVLDAFADTDRLLLIELKTPAGRPDFLHEMAPIKDHVILQSFNDDNIRAFIDSGFRAIQLMGSPEPVIPGAYAVGPNVAAVTTQSIDEARAQGAQTWLWGTDLRIDDERTQDLDIDGYIVNDPRP